MNEQNQPVARVNVVALEFMYRDMLLELVGTARQGIADIADKKNPSTADYEKLLGLYYTIAAVYKEMDRSRKRTGLNDGETKEEMDAIQLCYHNAYHSALVLEDKNGICQAEKFGKTVELDDLVPEIAL